MRVTVLDTETTGTDPEVGSVVEIAGVDLETGRWHQSLVQPEHPISFGAMATHLITEEMVASASPLDYFLGTEDIYSAPVLVAHNAAFDRSFLPGIGDDVKWICTYRCALHLMPDAESHRNIALCLEAGLDIFDAPDIPGDPGASMPHRALFDAWATRKLLQHLMGILQDQRTQANRATEHEVIDRLVSLTVEPVLLKKVRFGKHSGQEWSEVPTTYLNWILGQDFDEDVRHTADYWLRKRGMRR